MQQDAGSAEDTQPLGQDMEKNGALQKAAAHPFLILFFGSVSVEGGGVSAVALVKNLAVALCGGSPSEPGIKLTATTPTLQ